LVLSRLDAEKNLEILKAIVGGQLMSRDEGKIVPRQEFRATGWSGGRSNKSGRKHLPPDSKTIEATHIG
jgi:hypothetical protein